MPGSSSLLLFVSAAVVLLVIPGPAVLYVTSRSIGQGRSAGFVSALGIGVGTLVHAAAAACRLVGAADVLGGRVQRRQVSGRGVLDLPGHTKAAARGIS